tara:strand:- start:742 stop:1080 length:339 start_codon:yes stop_codon:yes gene_type:complete
VDLANFRTPGAGFPALDDNIPDGDSGSNTTTPSMETSTTPDSETVTEERVNYTTSDVIIDNGNAVSKSNVHVLSKKDTLVKRKDSPVSPSLNTRDSIKAVKERDAKNKKAGI